MYNEGLKEKFASVSGSVTYVPRPTYVNHYIRNVPRRNQGKAETTYAQSKLE